MSDVERSPGWVRVVVNVLAVVLLPWVGVAAAVWHFVRRGEVP